MHVRECKERDIQPILPASLTDQSSCVSQSNNGCDANTDDLLTASGSSSACACFMPGEQLSWPHESTDLFIIISRKQLRVLATSKASMLQCFKICVTISPADHCRFEAALEDGGPVCQSQMGWAAIPVCHSIAHLRCTVWLACTRPLCGHAVCLDQFNAGGTVGEQKSDSEGRLSLSPFETMN